jgi:hypothetical protein
MGCNNSKIMKNEKIQLDLDNLTEVKDIKKEVTVINNDEVKKYNIKINITRPNPFNGVEENKNLRIKIPKY